MEMGRGLESEKEERLSQGRGEQAPESEWRRGPPGELEAPRGTGRREENEGGQREVRGATVRTGRAGAGEPGTVRAIAGRTGQGARRDNEEDLWGRPALRPRTPPVREIRGRSYARQGAQRDPEHRRQPFPPFFLAPGYSRTCLHPSPREGQNRLPTSTLLCPFLAELRARPSCFILGGDGGGGEGDGLPHLSLITLLISAFRHGRTGGPQKVGILTLFLHSDQYKHVPGCWPPFPASKRRGLCSPIPSAPPPHPSFLISPLTLLFIML